jgi:quinol---cytochrome-c reductase cytochrome c subunit
VIRRPVTLALALACAAGAVYGLAASGPTPAKTATASSRTRAGSERPASTATTSRGRSLFVEGCSSCHGLDAEGVPGQGPSLRGAGAAAADFYLSTGRMPLDNPRDEPVRTEPAYRRRDIDALVAYVGSLGGPAKPSVNPGLGRLNEGFKSFATNCAGCHQTVARGGIAPGAVAPDLKDATPTQIGEAVRIGPYLMPPFTTRQISDTRVNSIALYVESTKTPEDRGGWGIGHIGPIPEGMVAWLLAGVALILVARVIGERTE